MPELDQILIQKLFHLGERYPADFENPVPSLTQASQLADSLIPQAFETLVKKIIQQDDGEVAFLGRRVLEDMLLSQYPELKMQNPNIYQSYQRLVGLLKFVNLSARGTEQISELVEKYLLDAMLTGIPVNKKFDEVLDIYDDEMFGGVIAETLGKAMLKSTGNIGNKQIIRPDGKNVSSFIGNWLSDYNQSALYSLPAGEKRGAVQRITYVNKSQNTHGLSDDDRKLLLHVFELYDWLRYGASFTVKETLQPMLRQPVPRPPVASIMSKPAPVHGQDLDVLKKRIEQVVPNPSPGAGAPPSPVGRGELLMTPQEIKREVATPELITHEELELPPHQEVKKTIVPQAPKPVVSNPSPAPSGHPLPKGEGKPSQPVQAVPKMNLTTLASISMVDDLKKIEINHLRQNPLNQQIQLIKSKIVNLAQANRLLPYYTVNAFEQSPLFRAYLSHGQSKFAGSPMTNDLSQAEFEAIADLRKEIERL